MARNSRNALLKQYLDAGIQFTQMTRERAESIVKEMVEAGEVRRKQGNRLVDDLVERSRSNVEQLLETVRKEVQDQVAMIEVVSRDAFNRLEEQVTQLRAQIETRGRTTARRPVATAKKAAASRTTTAKKAAKRASSTAKKAARKATPRTTTARKTTAKKATARKSAAKRA